VAPAANNKKRKSFSSEGVPDQERAEETKDKDSDVTDVNGQPPVHITQHDRVMMGQQRQTQQVQ
jgi:hypothetical protein